MIDRILSSLLQRKRWRDANELADAIVSAASSDSPATVSSPVTILVDTSRGPGLRVVTRPTRSETPYRPAEPDATPTRTATTDTPRGPTTPGSPSSARTGSESASFANPIAEDSGWDQPVFTESVTDARPGRRSVDVPSSAASRAPEDPLAQVSPAAFPEVPDLAAAPRPAARPEAVETPPPGQMVLPDTPSMDQNPRFRTADLEAGQRLVENPIQKIGFRFPGQSAPRRWEPAVDLGGPVMFGGDAPSRFVAPPEVWSDAKKGFMPIDEWALEKQDHLIVGTHHYRPLVARVLSTAVAGRTWKCRIWQQSAPPIDIAEYDEAKYQEHWFDADVTVLNLPSNSKYNPPVGKYITVLELPDADGAPDNRFVHIPAEVGAVAITTSAITAGTATRQGSGTATLKIVEPGVDYASGESVTVYNTNDEVATGKIVQLKKIDGYWFVDVARC